MDDSVTNGAKEVKACESREKNSITLKHVFIRVFFDGTNNNAIQKATFAKIKKNRTESGEVSLEEDRTVKELSHLKKNKEAIDNVLLNINIHPELNPEDLLNDKTNGYSNIVILYSLLTPMTDTCDSVYYDIYLEGSGAADITHGIGDHRLGNINGLGFGLGKTGVTALVSKAVFYIHSYLTKLYIESRLDSNTKYHFYVFGFSRGATCARLFSEVVTRGNEDKLKCEAEFNQPTSYCRSLFEKDRLIFMDDKYLSKGRNDISVPIKGNVAVEVLGIYDTVASIGFLKQKDGEINGLSSLYKGSNYKDNFHYKNAHDYGLYSPLIRDKIKNVLHICAADEYRENFALVNLGKNIENDDRLLEIIMPGCHSDIGGGYIDEVGMDASINMLHPRKESYVPIRLFMKNPLDKEEDGEIISEISLNKAGWISTKPKHETIDKEYSIIDKMPFTYRYVENGMKLKLNVNSNPTMPLSLRLRESHEIKMKRCVLGGYSNIPLCMMLKFVSDKDEEKGCQLNIRSNPYNYDYKDKRLVKFGDFCKDETTGNGRKWILPESCYSGEFYRYIRLRYIHFTGSNKVIHTRFTNKNDKGINPVKLELNFSNIGNMINYDSEGRICRICYDGNKEYEGGHFENVKYMYDLENVHIIPFYENHKN